MTASQRIYHPAAGPKQTRSVERDDDILAFFYKQFSAEKFFYIVRIEREQNVSDGQECYYNNIINIIYYNVSQN